ncbi:MAG: chloride channel protein [Spirochaetaceae bacterium]
MFRPTDERSPALLLKWIVIGVVAGVSGAAVVGSFVYLLRLMHRTFWDTGIPLPLFALAGALVTGALIYRIDPRCAGEGVPSYVHGHRSGGGRLPPSETLGKYLASLATLGTFGVGGIVGPLGRVSAGVVSAIGQRLPNTRFTETDLHAASTAGLAAAVAVIFRSPVGAGIFAAEILQKSAVQYRLLFPAVIAGAIGTHLGILAGVPPLLQPPLRALSTPATTEQPELLLPVLVIAAITGLMGRSYSLFYGMVSRIAGRERRTGVVPRVLTGTLIAAGLTWLINPYLMGTSDALIADLAAGGRATLYGNLPPEIPIVAVLVLLALLKMAANSITVGSGLSAGFTGPAAIIGMLLARAVATATGAAEGSLAYHTLVAAGFTGMLASTLNVPIAAAVIGIELFGMQHGVAVGVSAVAAFQLNRRRTIYDSSLEGEPGYDAGR